MRSQRGVFARKVAEEQDTAQLECLRLNITNS